MDIIVERLEQTYDTKFLDNEDKSLVEEVYTHFETNNEKKVLCKLIDNHKNKKKPQPDFIGGPANLSCHWSEKYNKMIYIFGEQHTNKTDCNVFPGSTLGSKNMNIEDFMLELYKTTDCFIDFYFETYASIRGNTFSRPYLNRSTASLSRGEPRGISLKELRRNFLECADFHTRNKNICKLARTHYFDTRFIEDSNAIFIDINNSSIIYREEPMHVLISEYNKRHRENFANYKANSNGLSNEEKKPYIDQYNVLKDKIMNEIFLKAKDIEKKDTATAFLLKLIHTENSDKIVESFKKSIYSNEYNNHELSKLELTNRNMSKKIKKYINDNISKMVVNNLSKWKENINILNNPETKEEKYILCMIFLFKEIMSLHSLIADIYLLARIFKGHDLEKSPYERATQYDQPKDSHNIIIYAGDAHSQLYRNFFSYIGFDEIFFSGPKYDNYNDIIAPTCIDMRKNNEPFFSQHIINKYNDEKRIKKDQEKKKIEEDLIQVIPNIKILESILPRLVQTYDTKFLENMEEDLIKELYIYMRQLSKDFPQRKVLFQLIDNHENKKKPQPDFIGGPANLSCHWSKKYNKMIYIFGEQHTNQTNCNIFPGSTLGSKNINIEDFMLELYKTTDCFFDFYFERISGQNTEGERDFNLTEINKKFLECITYEKRNNPDCKLTRTHYFDSNELEFYYNSKLSFTVSDIITTGATGVAGRTGATGATGATGNHQSDKESERKDIINIYLKEGPHKKYGIVKEELYNFIQTSNSEKIKEYWRDQIYENIYVDHELSRLDKIFADKIRKYVDIRINNFVDSQLDYWKKLIHFVNPTEHRTKLDIEKDQDGDYLEQIYRLFKSFYVILQNVTDVYMFARMFKFYNVERLPYEGATKYDQPRDSHNIIIYASHERSRLYRDFLKFMDFKMISSTLRDPHYSKSNTCLDMRHFPMPFFSQSAIDKYDIDNGLLVDVISSLKNLKKSSL
jgi:hypothetical protein